MSNDLNIDLAKTIHMFCDVTSCNCVGVYVSEERSASIFRVEQYAKGLSRRLNLQHFFI
jgi:hypothetical protein